MVDKKNILVTGSDGQLGKSIKRISNQYDNYNFIFTNKDQLNISEFSLINKIINENSIKIVINCAAYTNVEEAENNKELADLINHVSVDNLANICSEKNIQLVHISTDFVFDGMKKSPYNENDIPNPINYYGLSKLNGENKMMSYNLNKSIVIRTSWLYSDSENNFVSKILKKINNYENINVVNDEIGSPTNVVDLAELILCVIPMLKNDKTEIYHFSNSGFCSRYNFSNEINKIVNGKSYIISENILKSKTIRPKYSVLDSTKIINEFDIKIKNWKKSLSDHLSSTKNKLFTYEI
tara:strand:+ start:1847 stop:2734 length:888 start_codon:yes stop_codon:yes gene_type:complete